MKKLPILFLSLIFVLSACVEPKEMMQEVYHTGFDFTKYASKTFLFTPEGYLGEYQSIGIINTVMYPEIKKADYRFINNPKYKRWDEGWSIKDLDVTEAIDSMYNQAVRMGANAIIRFTISSINKANGYKTVSGIEVSGFAIKRK